MKMGVRGRHEEDTCGSERNRGICGCLLCGGAHIAIDNTHPCQHTVQREQWTPNRGNDGNDVCGKPSWGKGHMLPVWR